MTKQTSLSNWKDIKSKIGTEDRRALVALISELFDLSKGNRDFLGARYLSAGDALGRYKRTVSEAICPDFMNSRNARIDFARAGKAVSDFRRACGDTEPVLDLMIHYVEVGTRQANDLSVDYESYYTSLESMFSSVIRALRGKESVHLALFLPRLRKIVATATDGYGYRDTLEDLLDELLQSEAHA